MHQIESSKGYAIKIKVQGLIYNKCENSGDITTKNPSFNYFLLHIWIFILFDILSTKY